jgi:hypothetical protein
MAAFGDLYYLNGGSYYGTSTNVWTGVINTATTWPNQPIYIQPATDWEKAAVKAEPDDEFTWLRKRVREVEEMAFSMLT